MWFPQTPSGKRLMKQELDHVLELAQDRGMGIVLEDEEAAKIIQKGKDIRHSKDVKAVKWVKAASGLSRLLTCLGRSERTSFQTSSSHPSYQVSPNQTIPPIPPFCTHA